MVAFGRMASQLLIDQAGLPAGTPGVARTDGLDTGALVTLTNTGTGSTTRMALLWVPPGDTTAASSLAPTVDPKVWTFTPTAGLHGTYLVELIEDEGLPTQTREIRVFGVRTPIRGLLIPAFNEVASSIASLVRQTAAEVAASQDNADDYANPNLAALQFAGWWRSLAELYAVVEAGGGGGGSNSVGNGILNAADGAGGWSALALTASGGQISSPVTGPNSGALAMLSAAAAATSGSLLLNTGTGVTSGTASLYTGVATTASGSIFIQPGDAGTNPGGVTVRGGNATGSGNGGLAQLLGGQGAGTGDGADVSVTGGAALGSGDGGRADLVAGAGATGGSVLVAGANGSVVGGDVLVRAGNGPTPGDLIFQGGGGTQLIWPPADGAAGEVLATDGLGNLGFIPMGGGGGAVSSVFARTGAVVAVSGDYAASDVTNDSGVAGADVAAALDTLEANLASYYPLAGTFPANVFYAIGPDTEWVALVAEENVFSTSAHLSFDFGGGGAGPTWRFRHTGGSGCFVAWESNDPTRVYRLPTQGTAVRGTLMVLGAADPDPDFYQWEESARAMLQETPGAGDTTLSSITADQVFARRVNPTSQFAQFVCLDEFGGERAALQWNPFTQRAVLDWKNELNGLRLTGNTALGTISSDWPTIQGLRGGLLAVDSTSGGGLDAVLTWQAGGVIERATVATVVSPGNVLMVTLPEIPEAEAWLVEEYFRILAGGTWSTHVIQLSIFRPAAGVMTYSAQSVTVSSGGPFTVTNNPNGVNVNRNDVLIAAAPTTLDRVRVTVKLLYRESLAA